MTTIVVEDGTGLTTANAYDSVANVTTYHADRGNTAWAAATTAAQEEAVVKATEYLDSFYLLRWKGTRTNETQALSWPRESVVDQDDFDIDNDEIPTALKRAMAEAALRALSGDLIPDLTDPGAIERDKTKVGPIEVEVEYFGGNDQITKYREVDLLLRGLLHGPNHILRA